MKVNISTLVVYWLLVDLPYLFYRTLLFLRQDVKRKSEQSSPYVSVLIPAYNEEETIAEALDSAARQRYPNFEIIVIDDGSADRTKEIVQKLETLQAHRSPLRPINLIRLEKNQGKANALNAGLKRSRGEIIVTMDADTFLAPRALSEIVKPFSNVKVGAVAGTIKTVERGSVISLLQKVDYEIGIDLIRYTQSKLGVALVTPGAFSAYRKSILHAFELGTLTEDFDTSSKILKLGYEVRMAVDAIAYTQVPIGISGLIKQRVRWQQGGFEVYSKRDLFSSGIFKGIEWFFTFFYGFVGVYNRLITLAFVPLFFYNSIIILPYFLAYSVLYWVYFGFLTFMRTRSIESLTIAPLYALYQHTILAYATIIGQLRALKRERKWE